MTKTNPLYVLDECAENTHGSKLKDLFVHARSLAKYGASDQVLSAKALKKNLTIVTQDKRFALETLLSDREVIFENIYGLRLLIKPKITVFDIVKSKTRLFGTKSKIKRKKMLADHEPFAIYPYGFNKVNFL